MLLLLAACYQPTIRSGAPCSTSNECPDGQMCIAQVCTLGAGSGVMPDAGIDGTIQPAVDTDKDGVPDNKDNCRDKPNIDQADEDGDAIGDACDLCPQIYGTANTDSDGDGIGDACDPNPGAHDTVWLYTGFPAGLPAWSRSPNWTGSTGSVVATSGNGTNDGDFLVTQFPMPPTLDNFSATMTVTVQALSGTASGDHSVGLEIWDKNANSGMGAAIDCGLDQKPAGSNSILYLQDDNTNNQPKSAPFSWTVNSQYVLTMSRHGSTYTCALVGAGLPSLSFTSNFVPRDGNAVDIWAFGTTEQYGSVQIAGKQ